MRELPADVVLADFDTRPPADWDVAESMRLSTSAATDTLALHQELQATRAGALLVILYGANAAGKDRTCRMLAGATDPRGVTFSFFGRPEPDRGGRDFLARYHAAMPERGSVAVFNRSYYDDVEHEILRGARDPVDLLQHIVAFEALLSDFAVRICRLYLHVSAQEQEARISGRRSTPSMRWKHSAADEEAVANAEAHANAAQRVLRDSIARGAGWFHVPCDDRAYADCVAATIVRAELANLVRGTSPRS
ncbi:MAG: hypothetical protein H7124_08930 [Phycisphaerales bacterium]|nr:hypothetical protein [Hyphomonadaceae bacterium]